MNERTKIQVLVGLALGGLIGCGSGAGTPAAPGMGGTTGTPGTGGMMGAATGGMMGTTPPVNALFTEDEKASILASLSAMPDKPWEDKSNKYGEDPAAAVLGQKFFFEPRYSSNQKISCATCHNPDQGFQDSRANTSSGPDVTMFTGRHAPTVINAAYGSGKASGGGWQFWDGRADSQWAQALGPPENDVEMGGSRTSIVLLIKEHYKAEYEAVFGPMPSLAGVAPGIKGGSDAWKAMSESDRHDVDAVYVNFGKAIAAYERKIVSRNARFDTFLADLAANKDDSTVFSKEEKLGLKVFVGKGLCISCHRGPNLTDWKFYNIGTQQLGPNVPMHDVGRKAGIETVTTGGFKGFNCMSQWSDHPNKSECAVATVMSRESDLGAFKTPGLRDITKTAPYKHTGRLKTLEEVVEHYDRGGGDPGTFDGKVAERDIIKLNLTAEEKAALVAFMKTLDGEALPANLMKAPPLPGLN